MSEAATGTPFKPPTLNDLFKRAVPALMTQAEWVSLINDPKHRVRRKSGQIDLDALNGVLNSRALKKKQAEAAAAAPTLELPLSAPQVEPQVEPKAEEPGPTPLEIEGVKRRQDGLIEAGMAALYRRAVPKLLSVAAWTKLTDQPFYHDEPLRVREYLDDLERRKQQIADAQTPEQAALNPVLERLAERNAMTVAVDCENTEGWGLWLSTEAERGRPGEWSSWVEFVSFGSVDITSPLGVRGSTTVPETLLSSPRIRTYVTESHAREGHRALWNLLLGTTRGCVNIETALDAVYGRLRDLHGLVIRHELGPLAPRHDLSDMLLIASGIRKRAPVAKAKKTGTTTATNGAAEGGAEKKGRATAARKASPKERHAALLGE